MTNFGFVWGAQSWRLESGWTVSTSTEACIYWAMQSPSPSPPRIETNIDAVSARAPTCPLCDDCGT